MNKPIKQTGKLFLAVCALVCFSVAHQPSPLERQYKAAQEALTAGNYPEAQRLFEKLALANPTVAEIHANLGLIYFEERMFQPAIKELRGALKLNPRLSRSAAVLAMSLSEVGEFTEALPGLEKGFHALDPEIKRMCGLQLERAYTALKRDSKAVEVALELNRLYPDDAEVLYHNGKIFGNFAFLTIQKLAQVAPDSIWRHEAAAEVYESQGMNDLATTEFREVLARDPQHPGIHFRLGRILLARSRVNSSPDDATRALKEFQQELQLDPTNANSAYEIADIQRNAGNFPEAANFFEQALKYYPGFEEAHLGLAATLLAEKKPELALPHVQTAIALNADDDVGWYRLAQVQRALGNTAQQQKAIAEFQRLRAKKQSQQAATVENFSRSEVTKQELGPRDN
ncbi:MAG: tetratricopeptide repeat protein [Terriglobales bacterium]